MNKRITLAKIQAIANELDNNGLYAQADSLTKVMVRIAQNVVDIANLPQESDSTGQTFVTINGEQIPVPLQLVGKTQVDVKGKTYTVAYDNGSAQFVLYDKKNPITFHPVDEQGRMRDTRSKSPWRLDKAIGIDIPNVKLPREIDKVLNRVKKDIVAPVSKVMRNTLGNPIKDNVTKPITDVFGRAGEQINIQSTGRKGKDAADLAHTFGESANRETAEPTKPNDAPTPTPSPTPEPAPKPTPGPEPPKNVDEVIKGRGAEIKNINSPNDLLFWCMSVGTGNSYSAELAKGVRANPSAYYNRRNQTKILNWIVTMTESPYVEKLNPKIKGFRREAIQSLYSKIRASE